MYADERGLPCIQLYYARAVMSMAKFAEVSAL